MRKNKSLYYMCRAMARKKLEGRMNCLGHGDMLAKGNERERRVRISNILKSRICNPSVGTLHDFWNQGGHQ